MSWWALTRKMRDHVPVPTSRPRWRHHLVVASECIGIVAAGVGLVMALTKFPAPKPAPLGVEASAWALAMDLAHASQAERALIPRPPVAFVPAPRLIPASDSDCPNLGEGEHCLIRRCGETEVFLTVDEKGDLDWTTASSIYLLPSESGLIAPVLTHEYLHTIWTYRVQHDVAFHHQHPDSESWVRQFAPVKCPAI